MQKKLKSFFLNDDLFLWLTVANMFICALYALFCFIPGFACSDFVLGIMILIIAVCVMALYASYRGHNKNVMKGLMGALLMAMLMMSVQRLKTDPLFGTVQTLLVAALMAEHFSINGRHQQSPKGVHANQVLAILIVVNAVVWNIVRPTTINAVFSILEIVVACSTVGSVVCIESKLDSFRAERENAGWTEEKGYPEEYDRTKNYGK